MLCEAIRTDNLSAHINIGRYSLSSWSDDRIADRKSQLRVTTAAPRMLNIDL